MVKGDLGEIWMEGRS